MGWLHSVKISEMVQTGELMYHTTSVPASILFALEPPQKVLWKTPIYLICAVPTLAAVGLISFRSRKLLPSEDFLACMLFLALAAMPMLPRLMDYDLPLHIVCAQIVFCTWRNSNDSAVAKLRKLIWMIWFLVTVQSYFVLQRQVLPAPVVVAVLLFWTAASFWLISQRRTTALENLP
jgi:hypothetical protein